MIRIMFSSLIIRQDTPSRLQADHTSRTVCFDMIAFMIAALRHHGFVLYILLSEMISYQ